MSDSQPKPINDQLNNLSNIDSSYDMRRAIEELDQNVTYCVTVVIDKIAENYSYVREDGYRDAYYVTGEVSGTEHRVKVLLPTAMNSEVQSWNEGDTKVLEALISDWDLAYKQFGLLGRGVVASDTEVVDLTLDPVADALTVGSSKQDNVVAEEEKVITEAPESVEAVEEPVAVADVKPASEAPESVEPVEEPVAVADVKPASEAPESVESVEEPVPVAEAELDTDKPDESDEATLEIQESETFLEQLEPPTQLEQLAKEHVNAESRDSGGKSPRATAIPVLDDVPTLENVPTLTAVPPPQVKRFSNHTPVRPMAMLNKAQEDEDQQRTSKIIKITVGIAVGIMLLMCVCCGVLSKVGG